MFASSMSVFSLAIDVLVATVPAPEPEIPGPPTELPVMPDENNDLYAKCRCEAEGAEKADAEFTGLVTDAQTFLAEDGKSIADRQATVLRVLDGLDEKTVKVFHSTMPDNCGLTFDYGKRYEVSVRSVDGNYETNYCIDPRRFHEAP